jgi:S-formylglutathione hydrolase
MMLEILSEQQCHGGVQGFYRHASTETGGAMRFGVFQPARVAGGNFRSCIFSPD